MALMKMAGRIGSLLCLLFAAILRAPFPAYGLPEIAGVESGSVDIQQPDSSTMNIVASDRSAVNFKSFSISASETVNFIQPDAASTVLSRVTGNAASVILGRLYANGTLILVNTNGIHIGSGARVQANAFVASTLDISTNNFLQGNYVFERDARNPAAYIVNEGEIVAGSCALLASAVSNRGVIQAVAGTVSLACGEKAVVSFDARHDILIAVAAPVTEKAQGETEGPDAGIHNSGIIEAHMVFMTARAQEGLYENLVNQEGVVRGTRLVNENGVIRITSGQDVRVSGKMEAPEGRVEVIAEKKVIVDRPLAAKGDTALSARGDLEIRADLTVEQGNLDLMADADLDGTGAFLQAEGTTLGTTGHGDITIRSSGKSYLASIVSGGKLSLEGAGASASYEQRPGSKISCAGSFTIGIGASVKACDAAYEIYGDWIGLGRFFPGMSRVEMKGSASAAIMGDNVFNDLIIVEPGKLVAFESGKTQEVLGTLRLKGDFGKLLSLRPTSMAIPWKIDPKGACEVVYVDVRNSTNVNILGPPIAPLRSKNSLNNTGWDFSCSGPVWTDAGRSHLWSDPLNWDGGFVPGEGDTARFDHPFTDPSFVDPSFQGSIDNLVLDYGFSGCIELQRDLRVIRDVYFKSGRLAWNGCRMEVAGSWHLFLRDEGLKEFAAVFSRGFSGLEMEIISGGPLALEAVPQGIVDTGNSGRTVTYALRDGITLRAEYRESKNRSLDQEYIGIPVKQCVVFDNPTGDDIGVTLVMRASTDADSVGWDGRTYDITEDGLSFAAYEKTVSIKEFAQQAGQGGVPGLDEFADVDYTYTAGDSLAFFTSGQEAAEFDFSDLTPLAPAVSVSRHGDTAQLTMTIENLVIPKAGSFTLDPVFALTDSASYNFRYDGASEIMYLTTGRALAIGDVNGDGKPDLVVGTTTTNYNGRYCGSVWVVFSTLMDDVGATTGNNQSLSDAANYSVRFDGAAAYDYLSSGGAIAIGDVNGDGLSDLVIGTPYADTNGTDSGSAYVIFSTLLASLGTTTGNILPLSAAASYNIRYDGAAAGDSLTLNRAIAIGDTNGDSLKDLVLGAALADNNGSSSGSAYIIFSTLIDDAGVTTGNNKALSEAANYNIRYDGGAANHQLTSGGMLINDLNGDLSTDLVLSAPATAYTAANAGSAYVVFSTLIDDIAGTGNNRALNAGANYNIRFDGAAASDYLTSTLSLASGDVNGDGAPDLVLGSYRADNNGADSGSAWIIFSTLIDDVGATTGNNKSLGVAANYNLRYDSGAASDYLTNGGAIAIGDVNGDGLSDLVLGAYQADNNGSNSGSAWVMFSTLIDDVGETTGNIRALNTAANYNIRYDGAAANNNLTSGGALAIGDVNGNGLSDLVLGAGYYNSNQGAAYVCFSTLVDDVGATTGNNKPLSVAANFNTRYSGATGNDYLTRDGTIAIGDLNGDGLADLALGSPYADGGGTDSGSAFTIFSTLIDDVGATTGNSKGLGTGTNYNVCSRGAVALIGLTSEHALAIGDVNGDNIPDLVFGAWRAPYNGVESGAVWVVFSTLTDDSGTSTGNARRLNVATDYNIRYTGEMADDKLSQGNDIVISDVNGDGCSDLILGAPWADFGGGNSGSVYVIFSTLIDDYGETKGNNVSLSNSSAINWRFDGIAWTTLTSGTNLLAGDVNGDGIADLVMTSFAPSYNGSSSGSAWVVFSTYLDDAGTTTGNYRALSNAASYNIRFDGAAANDWLTREHSCAIGDVNGDGKGDLVLGTYLSDIGGADSGSLWVVFSTLIDDVGTTTGNNKPLSTPGNYNIRFDGAAAGDALRNIAIGDVNGDGHPDLVMGATGTDYTGSGAGSVYVVFSTRIDDVGETTGNNWSLGTAANYNIRFDGRAAGDALTDGGWSVAPSLHTGSLLIGDVNGDGLSDLVLGAYQADNNGSNSGSAWVIFSTLMDDVGETTGNNRSLATAGNYNIRFDGAGANDNLTFLTSMAIGDVNGDLLPDLVLGAPNADTNGADSGAAYVIYSTLIDDVGATTGNNKPLSNAANYSIRYDGSAAGDRLSYAAVEIGDVDGNGFSDLALGAYMAGNGGPESGSLWVMLVEAVKGTVFTDEGITPIGAGKKVSVSLNGGAPVSAATTAGGRFAMALNVAPGDILALYLDDAVEKAVTVTVSDGLSLTDFALYQDRLIVQHEAAGPVTNAALVTAGNDGDADILALYTLAGNDLTVADGKELFIKSGCAFKPEGAVAVHDIDIDGEFCPEGNAVSVSGDWDVSGSFTSTGTVSFTGGALQTLFSGGQVFFDLAHPGAGTLRLLDPLDVDGGLDNQGGIMDADGFAMDIAGNWRNAGIFIANGNTVTFDGAGPAAISGTTAFYHLYFDCPGGDWTLLDPVEVEGDLSITRGTLHAGGKALTVGGNWNDTGTFDAGGNTVTFDNAGRVTLFSGDSVFYGLRCLTPGKTLRFARGSTQTVTGDLAIAGDAGDPVVIDAAGAGALPKLTVDPATSTDIWHAGVCDNDASDGVALVAQGYSTLSGLTPNWSLAPSGPATYTWTGAVSTDWDTAGNWNPRRVPSAADNVIIGPTALQPVMATPVHIAGLEIREGATLMTATNTLTVSGELRIDGTLDASRSRTVVEGDVVTGTGGLLCLQFPSLNAEGTIGSRGNPLLTSIEGKVDIAAGSMRDYISVSLRGDNLYSFSREIPGFIFVNDALQPHVGQNEIRNLLTESECVYLRGNTRAFGCGYRLWLKRDDTSGQGLANNLQYPAI